MARLMKYVEPYIGMVIIAIILLFGQAICDLSLPDYMSNIFNVGIQQGGVENAVTKVIKSSDDLKFDLVAGGSNHQMAVDENGNVWIVGSN